LDQGVDIKKNKNDTSNHKLVVAQWLVGFNASWENQVRILLFHVYFYEHEDPACVSTKGLIFFRHV
jgi:hypothetical protein